MVQIQDQGQDQYQYQYQARGQETKGQERQRGHLKEDMHVRHSDAAMDVPLIVPSDHFWPLPAANGLDVVADLVVGEFPPTPECVMLSGSQSAAGE